MLHLNKMYGGVLMDTKDKKTIIDNEADNSRKIEIGKRIKKLRKQHNMIQYHLAAEIGVKTSTLGRWEIGATEPRENNLRKLAEVLQTTYEYLSLSTDNENITKIKWRNISETDADAIRLFTQLDEADRKFLRRVITHLYNERFQ